MIALHCDPCSVRAPKECALLVTSSPPEGRDRLRAEGIYIYIYTMTAFGVHMHIQKYAHRKPKTTQHIIRFGVSGARPRVFERLDSKHPIEAPREGAALPFVGFKV